MKKDKPIPTTINFPLEIREKIDEAARITGLPKQEIIRLCMAIGLEDLRRINYDIAGAVVSQAKGNAPLLKVAETPDKEPMPQQVPVKYPKGR